MEVALSHSVTCPGREPARRHGQPSVARGAVTERREVSRAGYRGWQRRRQCPRGRRCRAAVVGDNLRVFEDGEEMGSGLGGAFSQALAAHGAGPWAGLLFPGGPVALLPFRWWRAGIVRRPRRIARRPFAFGNPCRHLRDRWRLHIVGAYARISAFFPASVSSAGGARVILRLTCTRVLGSRPRPPFVRLRPDRPSRGPG